MAGLHLQQAPSTDLENTQDAPQKKKHMPQRFREAMTEEKCNDIMGGEVLFDKNFMNKND